jgi:hypothetical protein
VPSPKAEPFKIWLAKVWYDRIEETEDPELVFNMLAEASTKEILEVQKPEWLDENKTVANKGWNVAKKARLELEKQTWDNVVSNKNALNWADKLKEKLN